MVALLRGATGRAVVFGRGARLAGVMVSSFAVIVTGSGLLVVASGGAAAVAHIRGRRVTVVGVVGLVSASTDTWVVAIGLSLAVVGVRHANSTVQRRRECSLGGLIFIGFYWWRHDRGGVESQVAVDSSRLDIQIGLFVQRA